MNNPADRLDSLNLSVRQAARILEMPRRNLAMALEESVSPRWLIYCLDGLEAAMSQDSSLRVRLPKDLPEALLGDKWAPTTARQAISLLVAAAKKGTLLTYKDLDEQLRAKYPEREPSGTLTKYGYALGRVGQAVLALSENRDSPFPPIEAIVVNGVTEIPGGGIDDFLKAYLLDTQRPDEARRLRKAREEIITEIIHPEIFAFEGWDEFLDGLTGDE